MNAKKCKALRRLIGVRDQEVKYNVPPLVPVHNLVLDSSGKPTINMDTLAYFKTATVTLINCARSRYQQLKDFAKANRYQFAH